MDFARILELEPHGPDTYVGTGPSYPWGGLYGGQIVAQALRAAGATVDEGLVVHSLHAYFIRLGDASEPIRFEVDRIRNGRTFATRRVIARQAVGAILNLSASFQLPEAEGVEVQTATLEPMPDPESHPEDAWSPLIGRRLVEAGDRGRARAWLRMKEELPADDRLAHACALAYLSDDLPTDAVFSQHPDRAAPGQSSPFWSASLDHAMWFHRPLRADRWHVHDFTCHGLMSSRGLAIGEIFTPEGVHVATVAQEVLVRERR